MKSISKSKLREQIREYFLIQSTNSIQNE